MWHAPPCMGQVCQQMDLCKWISCLATFDHISLIQDSLMISYIWEIFILKAFVYKFLFKIFLESATIQLAFNYVLHELKTFVVFNFRSHWRLQKFSQLQHIYWKYMYIPFYVCILSGFLSCMICFPSSTTSEIFQTLIK